MGNRRTSTQRMIAAEKLRRQHERSALHREKLFAEEHARARGYRAGLEEGRKEIPLPAGAVINLMLTTAADELGRHFAEKLASQIETAVPMSVLKDAVENFIRRNVPGILTPDVFYQKRQGGPPNVRILPGDARVYGEACVLRVDVPALRFQAAVLSETNLSRLEAQS